MQRKLSILTLSLLMFSSTASAVSVPISLLGLISTSFFLAVKADHSHLKLDKAALANEFKKLPGNQKGWNDKDGQAAKYRSAGSDYRTYKPETSETLDGLLEISTKIDHIRGWASDDHCTFILIMKKNAEGAPVLVDVKDLKLAKGKDEEDAQLIQASIIAAGALSEHPTEAMIISEVVSLLMKVLRRDGGGRANFPHVIEHNINWIAHSVKTVP